MRRILVFIISALLASCYAANGQNLLERLGQRAKNAVENKLGEKVEQGVNDALDGKSARRKIRRKSLKRKRPISPLSSRFRRPERPLPPPPGPVRSAEKPATQAISATTAAPRSPLEKPLLPPSPRSRWKPLMQRVTLSREMRFSLRIHLKMSSWVSSRHSGI